MKKNTFWIACMVFPLFLLTACGGGSQKDAGQEGEEEMAVETGSNPIMDMALESPQDIEDWLALVVVAMNEMELPESGLKNVDINGTPTEVAVYNVGGDVTMVRAAVPNWTNPQEAFRYFTRNDEVVVLEGFAKVENGFEFDRFYYVNGEVAKSQSRKGATLEEAQQAVPGPYEPEEGEHIAMDYERVKSTANQLEKIMEGPQEQ